MRRARGPTRTAAAVAIPVAIITLTACAGLPSPLPAEPSVGPAVTSDQAQRITARVAETVAAVVGPAWDPELAATRLAGPGLEWAAFAVAAGRAAPAGLQPGAGPPDLLVAPVTSTWPRAFAVVSGGDTPVLAVYVDDSPRTGYRLWAAMPVLDGEVVPAFAPADAGALVPTSDAGATADPTSDASGTRSLAAVVNDLPLRYADVLTSGDASTYAPEFAGDGFASALAARTAAEASRLEPVASVTVGHEVLASDGSNGVVFSALTASGDALVIAGFRTTTTAIARPGRGAIGVPDELAGVAGASSVTGSLTTVSVAALAFVVPAVTGNIHVVAAADGFAGVTVG